MAHIWEHVLICNVCKKDGPKNRGDNPWKQNEQDAAKLGWLVEYVPSLAYTCHMCPECRKSPKPYWWI